MLKKNIIKNHSIFIYIDINFIKRNLNFNIFKILMLDKSNKNNLSNIFVYLKLIYIITIFYFYIIILK